MNGHPSTPFDHWPRPLAFALSGGGAYGSVQVGMLRALVERGVRPDLVVGSSVGALNGAVFAASPKTAVATLTELWRGMSRATVFGRSRIRVLHNLARHKTLSNFDRLERLIDRHLDVGSFDDLDIRFGAVATDALTGEPDILATGELKRALLASSAVPGVFPRVDLDGRDYIDGGVTANVPIRQAIAFGARSVVTLDATPPMLATEIPRSLVGGLVHSATLLVRSQRSHAVDELVHRYPIASLPSATPPDMGAFNFDHTGDLLTRSYRMSADALDRWVPDGTASTTER